MDIKIRGISLSEGKFRFFYPKEGEMSVRQAETTDECHNTHDTWLRGEKKCKMTSGKGSIDTQAYREAVFSGVLLHSSLYVKILSDVLRASVEGRIIFLLWI